MKKLLIVIVAIALTATAVLLAVILRTPPAEDPPDISDGVPVDAQSTVKYGVNYSPYTGKGQEPGVLLPSEEQIRRQLTQISADFDSVRFFTVEGPLTCMYDIAHELGLRVVGTAWIGAYMDDGQIREQLDNLIALANGGKAAIASVGSETLHRGDLTPAELLGYINYVKDRLTAPVPVTYMDTSAFFMDRSKAGLPEIEGLSELNAACDLILFSHYPVFSGNYHEPWMPGYPGGPMQYAIDELKNAYNDVKANIGDKPCIIAETGWPTEGPLNGLAVPSGENARKYWDSVQAWASEADCEVFYFSAYDEEWKGNEGWLDARHWGLFNGDGTVKDVFGDIFPAGYAYRVEYYADKMGVMASEPYEVNAEYGPDHKLRPSDLKHDLGDEWLDVPDGYDGYGVALVAYPILTANPERNVVKVLFLPK